MRGPPCLAHIEKLLAFAFAAVLRSFLPSATASTDRGVCFDQRNIEVACACVVEGEPYQQRDQQDQAGGNREDGTCPPTPQRNVGSMLRTAGFPDLRDRYF